jgi:transposase
MALRVTMSSMKPYSEDLRTRIVKAVGDGMSKSKAARLFGVSLSSTKRYVKIANRGESLRPRKGGGRPPKTDELTKKLLEEDLQERPAATISERRSFLERACGKSLSDSTVRRLPLKRMGFSQKNGLWGDGARRVPEGRLEGDARPTDRSKAAGVRR